MIATRLSRQFKSWDGMFGQRSGQSPRIMPGWCRDAAIGAVLSLSLGMAAGCASPSDGAAAPSPQVQEETIGWFFPATVAQSESGAAFLENLHALSVQAVNECVSRSGFSAQAKAYVIAFEDYSDSPYSVLPGYTQQWDPDLIDVPVVRESGMLVEVVTGTNRPPSAASLAIGEKQAINADLSRCIRQTRQPGTAFQNDGKALRRLWRISTTNINNSSAVTRANRQFGSCVTRQGAPPAAASPAQFPTWLDGVVNPPAAYAGTLPPGPRASVDAHWSTVWALCAAPVVTVWQQHLESTQRAFLQAHYQEVTALEQQVAQSISEMEKMGTSDSTS
jgi:hypothetical protein